jgi:hypothetical protein
MKEASDRVSLAHVEALFAEAPKFLELLLAARSPCVQLPDGNVIPLRKFASMGSATCFPVEALVFFTGIIASRCRRLGRFPVAQLVRELGQAVYVYGDDLLVPSDEASAICDDLEAFGLKVNRRKSFWTGKFRESCGVDCYDGSEVTPVYLRRDLPADRLDTSGILSSVSTARQLSKAGYHGTAAVLRSAVERHLGRLPYVREVPKDLAAWMGVCRLSRGSPAIGWDHHSEVVPARDWHLDYQRPVYWHWVATSIAQRDPLTGDPALAKCLSAMAARSSPSNQGDPGWRPTDYLCPSDVADDHLDWSSRPYSLTLERRWVLSHQ